MNCEHCGWSYWDDVPLVDRFCNGCGNKMIYNKEKHIMELVLCAGLNQEDFVRIMSKSYEKELRK